ncbi:hypothetical protein HU200_047905 [Digitaria exilis]|uniref:Uncharacterized protein n=1 Tax=Digitaria exilis TaxID=1010633 RepID=A0A835B1S1_9POAL|nr:hypothetical protein HU200_047905 [Digitaria exilis]
MQLIGESGLADFFTHSEDCDFNCQKISRRMDTTTYSLDSQARTQLQQMNYLFFCNNPLHYPQCVVRTALQKVQWGASRLISVSCV